MPGAAAPAQSTAVQARRWAAIRFSSERVGVRRTSGALLCAEPPAATRCSTDGDLAAAYLKLAPEYAAYALSVILIGLYWTSSHFTGKLLQKTDHGYNLLSIGFLAAVSTTPFPARPLIEHLGGDAESKTAVLAYLGVAAAPDVVVRALGLCNREGAFRPAPDGRLPQADNSQIRRHCRSLLGSVRPGFLELARWTDRRGDRYVELYRSASKAQLQARPRTGEWLRPATDPARRMLTSAN